MVDNIKASNKVLNDNFSYIACHQHNSILHLQDTSDSDMFSDDETWPSPKENVTTQHLERWGEEYIPRMENL